MNMLYKGEEVVVLATGDPDQPAPNFPLDKIIALW